jgi:hypothetical protein
MSYVDITYKGGNPLSFLVGFQILSMAVVKMEQQKGVKVSGVLSLFWLLLTIGHFVAVFSSSLSQVGQGHLHT